MSNFGLQSDGTGIATLYLEDPASCASPHFNVRSADARNNTDPNVLGVPGEQLSLLVYDFYGYAWYPVTEDGVAFLDGGEMPPFDPISGWEYAH